MSEAQGLLAAFQTEGISSSWQAYLPFFVAAAMSLAVPAVLYIISRAMLFPQRGGKRARTAQGEPSPAPHSASRDGEMMSPVLGRRFNSRFFVTTLFAHLLLGMVMVLIPLAYRVGIVGAGAATNSRTLVLLLSIALLALLGLLHGSGKGDLFLLRTYRSEKESQREESL